MTVAFGPGAAELDRGEARVAPQHLGHGIAIASGVRCILRQFTQAAFAHRPEHRSPNRAARDTTDRKDVLGEILTACACLILAPGKIIRRVIPLKS